MAGYSGGRKVIAPGVAHKDTITTFHSARFMSNPAAANGILDSNPLHEEQLEIVKMLGGALALNYDHRRGASPLLREFWRDHREPPRGGG